MCFIYVCVCVDHTGCLEYETKELLRQHIDKDMYYSLDYLNQQIMGIELGFMESRDRPSTITLATLHSSDHKLKQEGMIEHGHLLE